MKVMLLDQQLHSLLWDDYCADGMLGLGCTDLQFSLMTANRLTDGNTVPLKVKVSPEKRQQFSSAQAAGQLQVEHREDISVCCGLEVCADVP